MSDEVMDNTRASLEQAEREAQSKKMIQKTFETVADAYGLGGARFFHSAGEYMAATLDLKGNECVLDIASGTGAVALPLARRLAEGQVTAVDFSSSMLGQSKMSAENEGLDNIDYHVQDMTAMPFPSEQFEKATCSFGLFFVEDMAALLTHIASKVKSGGSVLISGFCGESFMPQASLLFDLLKKYNIDVPDQPVGWKRMSEPEQLHELFNTAELINVEIKRESLGYYVDAEAWWEVVWNAGFRGLVAQLGDRLEEFKLEHFAELESVMGEKGLWLDVDVYFTQGFKR